MYSFFNKTVLITGATSGIGESTARLFAKQGANVILVGRSDNGRLIEKEINLSGGHAFFIPCDISDEEQVRNMVEKAVDKYKKIDVLFNNAGVMLPSKEIERLSLSDWNKTFSINTTGMFLVTKYCKPYIFKEKGVIINNASIAGLQYYVAGRSYAYSASKAAVIQLTHQMAKNYGMEGVRVNCICPGIVDTPILGSRDRNIYVERVPLGRLALPSDVAKVVVFLASSDADYLTGVILPIDGGVSL